MKLTIDILDDICGWTGYQTRRENFLTLLDERGFKLAPRLARPHDLAQFLAQVLHECMCFKYAEEIADGSAYEGRKDLGNVRPGDGRRYKGRDYIQCTGRYNYRAFTKWMRELDPNCPDFEATPDALMHPDWLGWAAIWYWSERVEQRYVDAGDIEMVTRRVNGGLNGYHDRVKYYTRAALVLAGYGSNDVRGFQADSGLKVDGIVGPRTRAALHTKLKHMPPIGGVGETTTAALWRELAGLLRRALSIVTALGKQQ